MKKIFIYAFAALMMGGFVASCSDDDPEAPVKPVDPKPEKPEPEPEPVIVCPIVDGTVFLDGKGLDLKYSGSQLVGKQVKFVANASDVTKATLVLSAAEGATSKAMDLPFNGNSGVVPGEKTTSVDITLKIDGEKVTFEGKSDVNGRVVTCTGSGTKDALSVDLKVTMPENDFTNKKFNLQAFKQGKTAPIVLKWNSEAKLPILGYPQPIQSVLDLVAMIGFPVEGTKDKLNINQMLAGVLNTVTFLPDGNIQASYKDDIVGGEWKDSPLNLASYKVDAEKKVVTVYINLPQILAFEESQSKSRAEEQASDAQKLIAEMIQKALGLVNTVLTEGIPVSYEVVDGVTTFYLDEKFVLPILQMVKPLLENKEVVATLMELIKTQVGKMDPNLAAQLPMIVEPIIKAFPAVIDQTKSMRFGLSLIPAAEEK